MSTTAVSSSSLYQELQTFFQQRTSDVNQLDKDLAAGNIANAQQDFNALQTLGQGGPSANGDVYSSSQREQDLTAVGQALQSGNLSAAQQAFAQLQSTFRGGQGNSVAADTTAALNSAAASTATTPTAPTTTSTSGSSLYQQIRAFFQQRRADIQQLGQDLNAGTTVSTAKAEQDYNTLQALGQSGPFKNGGAFNNSQREQDLNAIGQALQSGDLAGAQQAFAQLTNGPGQHQTSPPVYGPPTTSPPISAPPSTSGAGATSAGGTEIIINLANAPAGEQITVGITGESNGNDQVTISAANPQSQTPEHLTLDVNPNSNQQIFLNLFGNSSSSATQGSSLNTTA